MRIDLSDLNASYHSAVVGYPGALPNGIYRAELISAEITLSKNRNRQVQWVLRAEMSSGELGTTMKFSPLIPQGLSFLQLDLLKLGVKLDDLNELHDVLPCLVGTRIMIEVQDDFYSGFHKVDFLRRI